MDELYNLKQMKYKIDENGIYNYNCLTEYDRIERNSVDLILTDLPYGTTSCKWDSVLPFDKLWEMVNYVLKPNGRFITTSSQPFTSALVMSNPSFFHHEIIWNKRFAANYAQAKTHPQKIHENIIVFGNKPLYNPQMTLRDKPIKKGKNAGAEMYGGVSGLGREDYKGKVYTHKYPETIIEYNVRAEKRGLHPTQKPVSLFEYLVLTYSNKFDMVFDPCVGSGTTAIACENLDRDYICFEKDVEIYRKAIERLDTNLNGFENPKEGGEEKTIKTGKQHEPTNEVETKPCTIHGAMPSYLQEVEKEAYMMIQKYGKKRAEEEAILTAESYIEDINNLKYYNAEKIDLWDKRKFFWFEVAKCVRNWA